MVGIRLPGLKFRNQRVEAAYRKELVYGEDDADRAQPPTLSELFTNVRRNYFTLYLHYVYFDVVRYLYIQADTMLRHDRSWCRPWRSARSRSASSSRSSAAFSQVANSFQYLVNSWTTIVELISIYKRLRAFEATLEGAPLPTIDRRISGRPQPGDGEGVSRVAGAADALCTSCPHPARCEMVFSTV